MLGNVMFAHNDHMEKGEETINGSKSCYIIHNMNDIENHGRNIQWDNPVARRPSPPDKRDQYMCIVCLEDCLGMDRENICIVGGDCRFCAHEACMSQWFQFNLTCPVCRETVESSGTIMPAQGVSIDVVDIDTYNTERTNGKIVMFICATISVIGLGVAICLCFT